MQLFALVTVAAYCLISLILGVRLLLMARRTRELPELIVGLAFLTGGAVGYSFNIAAGFLLAAARPEAAHVAYIAGQVGMAGAAFLVLVAWRTIFMPLLRGGGIFVVVYGIVMAGSLVHAIMVTGSDTGARLMQAAYLGLLVLEAGCYGIMGYASVRHSMMLNRRRALGLADPVIANRLLLWGVSNSATTSSYIYSIVAGLALMQGLPNIYHPSVIATLGSISAFAIVLGFMPPRAYLDRIRANAAQGGA